MPASADLIDLFRRIPVALYRSAPDGSILAANPALATLLGYTSVEEAKAAIGNVESVYVDRAQRQRWMDRITDVGVIQDFDIELKRSDGSTLWVRDSARAISDESGQLLFFEGSLIDVTDKIRAQQDRDEFVATVSHELRNPIAAILGLGDELARTYDSFSDMERREMADLIARQAEDAGWLIEDLLVAYRGDINDLTIDPRRIDVVKEIERVLETSENVIEIRVKASDTEVYSDPQRVRQILRNLVSNAERYGGESIEISVDRAGDRIEVEVRDSGGALNDSDVERIFRAFERGSGSQHPKSVGLGLSVARRLARLMDGDLVYRHDGEWAAFVLSLPSS